MGARVEPSPGLKGDPPAAATAQGLADRHELALVAVERARMPMVVTDPRQPDNPIVLANQAFLDLTGYSAADVLGRNCRFLQGPETSPESIADVRASVAAGREANVELLNYRRDGSTFWNQVHLSPIRDDHGALVYFFGCQQDVTARRLAENLKAVEHRLLREVDHRAMNVLALVNAIVRLSAAEDSKRYAAAVQGRVQALALAHSALAARGWTRLPLRDLLVQHVGQVHPTRRDRVILEGPDTAVSARDVQPLALVFHELFANAATHGALSVPEGSLEVIWAEEASRYVRLHWRERGGPPPAERRPKGFGSRMVRSIVERQLAGKLTRTWSPAGLAAELQVPFHTMPQ